MRITPGDDAPLYHQPGRLATGMMPGAAEIAPKSLKFIALFHLKRKDGRRARADAPSGGVLPAFARICRYRRACESWQHSPAPRPLGVISHEKEFSEIYRIFSKFHILEQADRRLHHTGTPRSRAVGKCGQMRSRLGGRAAPETMIFGATRGAGSENGFRPGEGKSTGGLSSILHLSERPATANAGKCRAEREREGLACPVVVPRPEGCKGCASYRTRGSVATGPCACRRSRPVPATRTTCEE